LRFRRPVAVQQSQEKDALLITNRKVDPHCSGSGDHFVLGIRDDDANGRQSAAQIRMLSEDVYYGSAKNLGDGLRAFERCGPLA
jgi:hypothetical protein